MPITKQKLETSPSLAPNTSARRLLPDAPRCQGSARAISAPIVPAPLAFARHGLNHGRGAPLFSRDALRIALTRVFITIREFRGRDGRQHEAGPEAPRQLGEQASTKSRHETLIANTGRGQLVSPKLRMAGLRLRQLQEKSLRMGSASAAARAAYSAAPLRSARRLSRYRSISGFMGIVPSGSKLVGSRDRKGTIENVKCSPQQEPCAEDCTLGCFGIQREVVTHAP
jgi:hypothetical protein